METTKPRNPNSLNWKEAVDELIRGRGLASQLGAVLEEALPTSSPSRDILRKVSDSLSRALFALDTGVKSEEAMGGEKEGSTSGKKRKMESGQRGDGCRRRVSPCKSITTTTLKDGYSWRKYGQKVILNYKSPRGYYRCTHKKDQKCLATRRVQQSEENPSLFVITYTGEHTCRPELRADAALARTLEADPCVIDFSCSWSSATTATTGVSNNQERRSSDIEEVVSGGGGGGSALKSPGSSSSGYLATPELDALDESARLVEELMGGGASEHRDVVTSCLQPYSSIGDLGWDLMDDEYSFDINCIFDYNQGGTLD